MNWLSLFSGIGCIDSGLAWAGHKTVAFCEIEPWCRENALQKHWKDTVIYEDVRQLTGDIVRGDVGPIDGICGGFPCQDVSFAGKGEGIKEGTRSGLWLEYLRLIRELQPAWVLVENVPALRLRGGDGVLSGLEKLAYTCWPVVVGAWAVGAPHKRDRVWIVAKYKGAREGDRGRVLGSCDGQSRVDPSGMGDAWHSRRIAVEQRELADAAGAGLRADGGAPREAGRVDIRGAELADAERTGLEGHRANTRGSQVAQPWGGGQRFLWPSRPGEPQHEWEAPRLLTRVQLHGDRAGQIFLANPNGLADAPSEPSWSPGQPRESADTRDTERALGAPTDGNVRRLVRQARAHNKQTVKAAGNGVVPQIPYLIGLWIKQQESQ